MHQTDRLRIGKTIGTDKKNKLTANQKVGSVGEIQGDIIGIKLTGILTLNNDNLKGPNSIKLETETPIDYLEQYKKDIKISDFLNKQYSTCLNYKDGEFDLELGKHKYYDTGSAIFVPKQGNAKIFRLKDGEYQDSYKVYCDIIPVGNFFMGRQESTNFKTGKKVSKYILFYKNGFGAKKLDGKMTYDLVTGLYKDSYSTAYRLMYTLYDKDLNLLWKNIPQDYKFIYTDHKYGLFYDPEKNNYAVLYKGNTRRKSKTVPKDVEKTNIYKDYIAIKKNEELINNTQGNLIDSLQQQENLFDLQFIGDSLNLSQIKNQNGESVFLPSNNKNYIIQYPGNLTQKDLYKPRMQKSINKGLFILTTQKDQKITGQIFLNANTGKTINFNNDDKLSIRGNILQRNFGDQIEIYNTDGDILGKNIDFEINDDTFKIISKDGQNHLVEISTGEIKEQSFDKILRIYDDENQKHIIVQAGEGIKSIVIQK